MEKDPISLKRYAELDFARAFPLLGLPFVHFYELLEGTFTDGVVGTWWGGLFLYLCMIGPSVFMMCLGMNIVFSSRSSPKELVKRGLMLIGLHYALNLIRFLLPGALALLLGYHDVWMIGVNDFICSDILFFAGAAFLFFALMKKLRVKPFYILLISVALLTLNMLISEPGMPPGHLSYFLGNFFYANEFSFFPFLSWIIFPAVGYCLGHIIKNLRNDVQRRRFFMRMLLGGAVGFAAVCVCISSYGFDPFLIAASPINSYITDLANVALDGFISCAWIGAAYFIYGLIRTEKARKAVNKISRSIVIFFCVQWIVVSWLWHALVYLGFYEQPIFSEAGFFLAALAVFAVSIAVTLLIQNRMENRKKLAAERGGKVI